MMKSILGLLEQKNKYLLKFEELSSRECRRLYSGNFNHIQKFYKDRQKLLKSIDNIDHQLNQKTISNPSKEDKTQFLKLLKTKKKIILSILNKDLQICSQLNEEKASSIKEQLAG